MHPIPVDRQTTGADGCYTLERVPTRKRFTIQRVG